MQPILLRVTQLNAAYLDSEIYSALRQILHNSINHLPPGWLDKYESELNILLRLAILNYSVLKSGSTFGQQLLCIKYEDISTYKRILYIVASSLGYVKDKLEYWNPTHEINNAVEKAYLILRFLDLLNFSVFLCNGTKPLLIERILGLKQVYIDGTAPRTFNSKFFARELLWTSCIEILIHIVPLINFHKIKRITRHFNPFYKSKTITCLSKATMTIHSKCAVCQNSPILPHHMGCTHVFCFYCLKGNLEADPKFACPICDHWNENVLCERVTVF